MKEDDTVSTVMSISGKQGNESKHIARTAEQKQSTEIMFHILITHCENA